MCNIILYNNQLILCFGKDSCGNLKLLKDFKKDKRHINGIGNLCKECYNKQNIKRKLKLGLVKNSQFQIQERLKQEQITGLRTCTSYCGKDLPLINFFKHFGTCNECRKIKMKVINNNGKERKAILAKTYYNPIPLENRRISQGEQKVVNFLRKNNIEFKIEESLDCRDNKTNILLSFDFYLPQYNLVIEFNGKQHYNQIPFFHKNFCGFYNQIRRDNFKKQFCKEKLIEYLEIPYNQENNINQILTNKIVEYANIKRMA